MPSDQSTRILAIFERWLRAEPGRSVTLEYDAAAGTCVVTASTKYQGLGVSLVDAGAQVATAVSFEEAP